MIMRGPAALLSYWMGEWERWKRLKERKGRTAGGCVAAVRLGADERSMGALRRSWRGQVTADPSHLERPHHFKAVYSRKPHSISV